VNYKLAGMATLESIIVQNFGRLSLCV